MRAPVGKILIQREAPPEKVGAIFVPDTALPRTAFASVVDSNIPSVPSGVRAICTMEMGDKVGEYTLLRDITSVYGWLEGDTLKLPPNRIAVMAKKDEHESDFIYIPGNFLRRDEAIGSKQRWVRGTVHASTYLDLPVGTEIFYYEAAETMTLDWQDLPEIPKDCELRLFPNRKYEPIDSVVCIWND